MITQTQMIELLKKAPQPENQLQLAQMHINLGASLQKDAKFQEALEQKQEGFKIIKVALGEQSVKLISVYYSLAETLGMLDKYDEAVDSLGEALKLIKLHKGADEDMMKCV